eukprot:TRINITY_DN45384_c0_g1_i1.p1 TRINITY_DN45384_c0_g1~~TRINITY_DN45384_c0_g1_i1.p1  ORF type:complete len:316 (-),score=30.79 TRINITY_DN45384_c0_g1_i1:224-1054(-)
MANFLLGFAGLVVFAANVAPLMITTWRWEVGFPMKYYGLDTVKMEGCKKEGGSLTKEANNVLCEFMTEDSYGNERMTWQRYHDLVCKDAFNTLCNVMSVVDAIQGNDEGYCNVLKKRCGLIFTVYMYNQWTKYLLIAASGCALLSALCLFIGYDEQGSGFAGICCLLSVAGVVVYFWFGGSGFDNLDNTEAVWFKSFAMGSSPTWGFYAACGAATLSSAYACATVMGGSAVWGSDSSSDSSSSEDEGKGAPKKKAKAQAKPKSQGGGAGHQHYGSV